jgi:hypothetical protein
MCSNARLAYSADRSGWFALPCAVVLAAACALTLRAQTPLQPQSFTPASLPAGFTQELDRLGSHLTETLQILDSKEPAGRRLDFLMQELNREANTLSSKSQDVDTTRTAVDIKVLIEQMREQVQNVE